MWLVEGPFDQNEQMKLKLLKPGRKYPLGRKRKQPLQLVVANPKVSGEHISFVVGPCSVDNVNDPSFRPSLILVNHRTKPIQLARLATEERMVVNASSELKLEGGESIALVTGVYINVHWRPVCCFSLSKDPLPSSEQCSSLGIKVVSTSGPDVTHHLAASLEPTTAIACSLLSSVEFVRPGWLEEIVRLGSNAPGSDAPSILEQEFRFPDASQYRPDPNPDIPDALKATNVWVKNDKRTALFKGWRFLFPCRSVEIEPDMRKLVELGDGRYEAFDVEGGATSWEQVLSRNKRKVEGDQGKHLAIVGDRVGLRAALADTSKVFFETLKREKLRLVSKEQLLEAVCLVNTTIIDSSQGVEDSGPTTQAVPCEPIQVAPKRKLPPRRVNASREATPAPVPTPAAPGSSSQVSVETPPIPAASAETQASTQKRRPLIKRKAAKDLILGVDDPSIADIPESQIPQLEASNQGTKPPSKDSSRPRSLLLKRRVGTNLGSLTQGTGTGPMDVDPQNEPPLKKYRALFEETDPDRVTSQMSTNIMSGSIPMSGFSTEIVASSTADGTQDLRRAESLAPIQEEDQSQVGRDGVGGSVTDKDALAQTRTLSMGGTQSAKEQSATFDSTQKSKNGAHGAAPGQPDTDTAFLQALATTKKGKRHEDDFDREFNNLRISKPEQDKDDEAENYKVLAQFEDEENILGNFMVIMEMNLPFRNRDENGRVVQASRSTRPEWEGKPDFKKFKKRTAPRSRPAIALYAEEPEDYGTGPGYWKNSQSQSHSQEPTLSNGPVKQSQVANKGFMRSRTASRAPEPPKSSNLTQTQMEPRLEIQAPKVTNGRTRGQSRVLSTINEENVSVENSKRGKESFKGKGKAAVPLFLDTDNDDSQGGSDSGQRPPHSATSRGAVSLEDDNFLDFDDDDASGEGTLVSLPQPTPILEKAPKLPLPSQEKRGKKRAAETTDDDDDEGGGGMAFRGFGRGKRART